MTDNTYCYPPDYSVLKNKAGYQNSELLERFEHLNTQSRALDCPRDLPINYEGYKSIHAHLFQDVYEWAGQPRTIPMSKGRSRFELPERIDDQMQRVFSELQREKNLSGLDKQQFAEKAAPYLDDLNITHPFREGNGRTQRVFLRNLAHQAGHELKVERINKDDWMRASIESMHASKHAGMAQIITNAITDRSRLAEAKISQLRRSEQSRDSEDRKR